MASLPNGVKHATMFTADNLHVLRGMDDECIDLIYLDPPFNSKKQWSAPIGSKAAGASFKDAWTFDDVDDAWLGEIAKTHQPLADLIDSLGPINGRADESYLIYMAVRLLEMHRVLKSSGSLYLHCDPVMSHSLKLVMDSIFGGENFRNEIIWSYHRFSRRGENAFPAMHDTILFYAKREDNFFNIQYTDARDSDRYKRGYHTVVDQGKRKLLIYDDKVLEGIDASAYDEVVKTKARRPVLGSDWADISIINPMAKERTGYPAQKPLKLLERIIFASTRKGDWVLDPFAGCATTCVAAEELNRNWIGIDLSGKAFDLVNLRFKEYLQIYNPVHHRTDLPVRSSGIIRTKEDKSILYGRQRGNCLGCMKHFEYRHLELDHIILPAAGGQDHTENLQLLCGSCNRIKGRKTMAELKARLKELGIFA